MAQRDQSSFYSQYIRRKQGDLQEDRIRKIVSSLQPPLDVVLDIGCGRGTLLRIIAERFNPKRLIGVDVAKDLIDLLDDPAIEAYSVDASQGLPLVDGSVDAVVCGEVIEHVIDPDNLLREMHRVLRPGGTAIITTPNLAYVANRLLLLLGIQPLFTETSTVSNLGRGWKLLGQDGATQGHLKIFTLGALRELTQRAGFKVEAVEGYRFFQNGPLSVIDGVVARKPSFAAGFVLRARKMTVR